MAMAMMTPAPRGITVWAARANTGALRDPEHRDRLPLVLGVVWRRRPGAAEISLRRSLHPRDRLRHCRTINRVWGRSDGNDWCVWARGQYIRCSAAAAAAAAAAAIGIRWRRDAR